MKEKFQLEQEGPLSKNSKGELVVEFRSGQATAKKACQILLAKKQGFVLPTASQKSNLLVAFAKKGKVVYGKAFDILKLLEPVDLNNLEEVERKLSSIIVYEIKSTKKPLNIDFRSYFFALTGAEVLVAQSLKQQFKFVFVSTATGVHTELTLPEIFSKAKGIYPTWSICF